MWIVPWTREPVNSVWTMPFVPCTVLTCDVTVHVLKKKKKTPQMWVWKRRSRPTLNECLDRTYCVSAFSISRFLLLFFFFGTCLGNNFHYYGYCLWTAATQFDFSAHQWVLCTIHGIHKPHFLTTFSLKMGLTILFTHLKIILLLYFQF